MARRHPGLPAVVGARATVTIGTLCERAAALAVTLGELGVTTGSCVGIQMDKSAEACVAVYAVLMAGGVCVPVPASWPEGRTDSALAACGAAVVVTPGGTAGDLPIASIRRPGERPGHPRGVAGGTAGDPLPPGDPSGPALLLFTSGSTGSPKGVTLSHRAVETFVRWAGEALSIGPSDRVLCPSPLNFDLSTLDVFGIAVHGAASVVMPEELLWMPRHATKFAREAGATIWYSVPSILVRQLEEGSFEQPPISSLRTILFAGEVMPPAQAARLRRAYPAAGLWNLYGPTETNVVTAYALTRDVDPSAPLPIGQPCPYAQLRLDPATIESEGDRRTGELLVGGPSLMTGYWGRPDETGRALVRVRDDAGVFYRTGDRVAEGADGTYWFLGRLDRQVKRRGVRIELGEIEAALADAPSVSETAAVAVGDGPSAVIVAFVAAPNGATPGDVVLRAHCARRVPSYMMPDEIIQLTRLPRGSRGKVDYDALRRICERSRLDRADQ
jgi:L-proline---[L-prolyl-carrier protein] ligase